jgi:hypothetical protein
MINPTDFLWEKNTTSTIFKKFDLFVRIAGVRPIGNLKSAHEWDIDVQDPSYVSNVQCG